MPSITTKTVLTATRAMALFLAWGFSSLLSAPADAANWPVLTGTEEGREEKPVRVTGFIQPQFEAVFAEPVEGLQAPALQSYNGRIAAFNTVGPNDTTKTFRVQRARLIVRGTIPKTEQMVNYMLQVGAGQNAAVGDKRVVLLDASGTVNLPWLRLRAGMFKPPTSDEATEAVPLADMVAFSNVTARLLMERPLVAGVFTGEVNAFRDVGAMLFDAYLVGDVELSFATWLTNGRKNEVDVGDGFDVGGWAQAAYLFDAERQFKGERDELAVGGFVVTGPRDDSVDEVQRTRAGGTLHFRKSGFRARTEFVWADGAIPAGPAPPFAGSPIGVFDGQAAGATLLLGYRVVDWFEVNGGVNRLHLGLEGTPAARRFTEATLGVQFLYTNRARVMINGTLPWATAPQGTPDAETILATAAPRVVVQGTVSF